MSQNAPPTLARSRIATLRTLDGTTDILVVEDDSDLSGLLEAGLEEAGFAVRMAGSAEQGLALLEAHGADLVLSDINLPGMSGIDFCRRAKEVRPGSPVVVMTAFSSISSAVEAMQAGAHDYLMKPLDLEALALRMRRLLDDYRARDELQRLREAIREDGGFEGLLGTSAPMREVYALVERAAETDASVLITGESGTGKELVARALHRRSKRSEGPFVPVNCSAVPSNLFESELFGHAKGAFTDAHRDRAGMFVEAEGGTLFLDEFGEIPIEVQPKILRALEEREVRPVGGDRTRSVDVRFVAATNRDLEEAVEQGRFREDLFYRVNVIHVQIPPLRARGSDVLRLAEYFLDHFCARFEREPMQLSSPAAECLMSYDWPGNVRELRNSMERAVALAADPLVALDDLPPRVKNQRRSELLVGSDDPTELLELEEVERRYIRHVLKLVGDNKSLAAKTLGLDRKTLYRKLQRWGDETD